jgi:hypothetical protein
MASQVTEKAGWSKDVPMRFRRNPVGMSVAADPDLRTQPRRSKVGGRPPAREGMPVDRSVEVVRVGKKGQRTHIYDPAAVGGVLCGSGTRSPNGQTGNRNIPQLFKSSAQYVTCTRCQKLGTMNMNLYGSYLRPESG